MLHRPNISRALQDELFIRDGSTCIYCGHPGFHLDHVLPLSKGGPTSRANLVVACIRCNLSKHNKVDIDKMTKGFLHLLSVGENLNWIPDFQNSGISKDIPVLKSRKVKKAKVIKTPDPRIAFNESMVLIHGVGYEILTPQKVALGMEPVTRQLLNNERIAQQKLHDIISRIVSKYGVTK